MKLIKEDFKNSNQCALCGQEIIGYGNNGMPLVDGKVCDDCNNKVIEARIKEIEDNMKSSSLKESKKKRKQGYFVKYNAGDVEKGTEYFNKNMGNDTTSEGSMTEEVEDSNKLMSFEKAKKYLKDNKNIDLTPEEYENLKNLKESKSEKRSINIRESLNDYDKESCSTDLLNMYNCCKLTLEDKKQVVKYIINEDYKELEKYLYKKMR